MSPAQARAAILAGDCPDGAVVEGPLWLLPGDGGGVLPEGLTVEGEMVLDGWDGIRHLPPGLSARSLWIQRCAALEGFHPAFGGAFHVPGDLLLIDCPALHAFPAELSVGGGLRLERCPRAWSGGAGAAGAPPARLRVAGELRLKSCGRLSALPPELDVGGSLRITDCPALKDIRPRRCVGQVQIESREPVRGVGTLSFKPLGALLHPPAGSALRRKARPNGGKPHGPGH